MTEEAPPVDRDEEPQPQLSQSVRGCLTKALPALYVVAIAFLFFTVYFSPVIFNNQYLAPDDGRIQNLPAFYGKHSLWTPLLYCGLPLVADPLVQTFYPPALLLRFFHCGWNFYVICGYALSSACAYLYVLEITKSRLSAVVSAIVYSMSGYLFAEMIHIHMQQAGVFLPLSLWLVEKLYRQPRSTIWIALAALSFGCAALNGQMQCFIYIVALSGLYALYKILFDKEAADKGKFVVSLIGAAALGSALAAAQVLPTGEWTRFSAREHFSFDDFLTFSMNPVELIGAILPFLFGSEGGVFFGERSIWPATPVPIYVYVGLLPLMLLCIAIYTLKEHKQSKFWLFVMVLSLLVALGKATPLAFIVYHIPPFGMFRALYRFLAITSLATAVLSGIAVRSLRSSQVKERHLGAAITMLGLPLFILVSRVSTMETTFKEIAAKSNVTDISFQFAQNPALFIPPIIFILSAGALVLFFKKPAALWAKAALVAVLLLDLGFHGWFSAWRGEPVGCDYLKPPPHAEKYRALMSEKHQRLLPVRGGSGKRDELPPNISRFWAIASASGYEPLMLTRYGDLLNITEGGFLKPPWHLTAADRSFDILAVRYCLTDRGDKRLLALNSDQEEIWRKTEDIGTATVYENLRALPRCWLCSEAVATSKPDEVFNTIKTGCLPDGRKFEPEKMALLEPETAFASLRSGDQFTGDAKVVSLEDNRVVVELTCNQPAVLVLSDTFYPGWKCDVDGKVSEIERVDYVLRGVQVDKGRHRVTFKFEPITVFVGAGLSALAALVIAALLLCNLFGCFKTR